MAIFLLTVGIIGIFILFLSLRIILVKDSTFNATCSSRGGEGKCDHCSGDGACENE